MSSLTWRMLETSAECKGHCVVLTLKQLINREETSSWLIRFIFRNLEAASEHQLNHSSRRQNQYLIGTFTTTSTVVLCCDISVGVFVAEELRRWIIDNWKSHHVYVFHHVSGTAGFSSQAGRRSLGKIETYGHVVSVSDTSVRRTL